MSNLVHIMPMHKHLVKIWDDHLEVTLPDGRQVISYPMEDPAYAARARNLGYATALEMCLDHDLFHVMVSGWLALPVSPALHAASGGNHVPQELTDAEEAVVLALQAYMNMLCKHGWAPVR